MLALTPQAVGAHQLTKALIMVPVQQSGVVALGVFYLLRLANYVPQEEAHCMAVPGADWGLAIIPVAIAILQMRVEPTRTQQGAGEPQQRRVQV
jgi:hypothetical protein